MCVSNKVLVSKTFNARGNGHLSMGVIADLSMGLCAVSSDTMIVGGSVSVTMVMKFSHSYSTSSDVYERFLGASRDSVKWS